MIWQPRGGALIGACSLIVVRLQTRSRNDLEQNNPNLLSVPCNGLVRSHLCTA